jgi:hypothetical protein
MVALGGDGVLIEKPLLWKARGDTGAEPVNRRGRLAGDVERL